MAASALDDQLVALKHHVVGEQGTQLQFSCMHWRCEGRPEDRETGDDSEDNRGRERGGACLIHLILQCDTAALF